MKGEGRLGRGTYDSLEDVVLGLEDELEVLLQLTTL